MTRGSQSAAATPNPGAPALHCTDWPPARWFKPVGSRSSRRMIPVHRRLSKTSFASLAVADHVFLRELALAAGTSEKIYVGLVKSAVLSCGPAGRGRCSRAGAVEQRRFAAAGKRPPPRRPRPPRSARRPLIPARTRCMGYYGGTVAQQQPVVPSPQYVGPNPALGYYGTYTYKAPAGYEPGQYAAPVFADRLRSAPELRVARNRCNGPAAASGRPVSLVTGRGGASASHRAVAMINMRRNGNSVLPSPRGG